jgi:hypothetical protein
MGAMLVAADEVERVTDEVDLAAGASPIATPSEAAGLGGLVSRLRGVPKGALKAVLGKELGVRAWEQARGKAGACEEAVRDAEIVTGLIRHLSQRAAEELKTNDRQAKFVRLTVCYQDGSSASERARLPGLTQESGEILEAAARLFAGFERPAGQVSSVNLDVTAAACDVISAASRVPAWLAFPVRMPAG